MTNVLATVAAPRRAIVPHTEAFAAMFRNASEADRTKLGEMHLHYEAEMQRMLDEGHEPQNIAYTINGIVDRSVEQTLKTKNGRKVQCARGCASCCKLNVSITREEAALLLIAAEQKRVPIDWAKVERQREQGLATWSRQSPADRRCVFLNDREECSVYEHRPSACRKYMVASDPKRCNTAKHPGGEVAIVAPIEGEAVVSAMLGILDWGSMPRMLLLAKEAVA
jgi:uncharacterized protein